MCTRARIQGPHLALHHVTVLLRRHVPVNGRDGGATGPGAVPQPDGRCMPGHARKGRLCHHDVRSALHERQEDGHDLLQLLGAAFSVMNDAVPHLPHSASVQRAVSATTAIHWPTTASRLAYNRQRSARNRQWSARDRHWARDPITARWPSTASGPTTTVGDPRTVTFPLTCRQLAPNGW